MSLDATKEIRSSVWILKILGREVGNWGPWLWRSIRILVIFFHKRFFCELLPPFLLVSITIYIYKKLQKANSRRRETREFQLGEGNPATE